MRGFVRHQRDVLLLQARSGGCRLPRLLALTVPSPLAHPQLDLNTIMPIVNAVVKSPAARAEVPHLLSLVGALGVGTSTPPEGASGSGGSGLNLDALLGLLGRR